MRTFAMIACVLILQACSDAEMTHIGTYDTPVIIGQSTPRQQAQLPPVAPSAQIAPPATPTPVPAPPSVEQTVQPATPVIAPAHQPVVLAPVEPREEAMPAPPPAELQPAESQPAQIAAAPAPPPDAQPVLQAAPQPIAPAADANTLAACKEAAQNRATDAGYAGENEDVQQQVYKSVFDDCMRWKPRRGR